MTNDARETARRMQKLLSAFDVSREPVTQQALAEELQNAATALGYYAAQDTHEERLAVNTTTV